MSCFKGKSGSFLSAYTLTRLRGPNLVSFPYEYIGISVQIVEGVTEQSLKSLVYSGLGRGATNFRLLTPGKASLVHCQGRPIRAGNVFRESLGSSHCSYYGNPQT